MPTQPLYPAVDLPAWPELTETKGFEPDDVQQWAAALAALGFEKAFERRFVSLEVQLENRHHAIEKQRKWGDAAEIPSGFREQKRAEWWRHPAGVLMSLSWFRRTEQDRWLFNEGHLAGIAAHGYGRNGRNASAFDEDGLALSPLLSNTNNQQARNHWAILKDHAFSGTLLPFEQWPTFLLRRWKGSPFCLSFLRSQPWHAPLTAAETKDLETPLSRWRTANILRARRFAELVRPWQAAFEGTEFSANEKRVWQALLSQEKKSSFLSTSAITKSQAMGMKASLRHEAAARALHAVLADFGVEDEPLTIDERAVVSHWLKVLTDKRHPRLITAALQTATRTPLSRLGVGFHHLLFKHVSEPGVLTKLLWWQAQQDTATLTRLCTAPEADGRSLPMRWLDAGLLVPARRVVPRRQQHRAAGTRRVLETLSRTVPPEKWAWDTTLRSAWDAALAPHINVPVDADLIAAHQQALGSLAAWFRDQRFPMPRRLRVPGSEKSLDLLDANAITGAIDQAGHSGAWRHRGPAAERLALLEPLIALLLEQHLGQNIGRTPALRRGTRL